MREDWVKCTLGDLLVLKNGFAFKSSIYTSEGIPVLRIGDINDWIVDETQSKCVAENKEYENYIVQKGDILIAMSGATTGKFGVYESDRKAYQNQRVGNLIPISKNFIDKKYIFNLLYSLKFQIEKEAYGGAQPNISAGKIHALNTVLAPLPEQRAIVAKIEELFSDLDNGIANLKKAQEQLKVYRQAVLKKAFEGELTKEWREKQTHLPTAEELLEQIKVERQKHYEQQLEEWEKAVKTWEKEGKKGKKPGKPKVLKNPINIKPEEEGDFNQLPINWRWSRLANMVLDHTTDIVDGPFGSNLKSTDYQNEGIPILRIQNIKANNFINKNIKYVTEEKYNSLKRHQFKPNDVIVTKLGDPLGLACRVPLSFNKGVIVADLIRINPSSSLINYDWLTLVINSNILQSQFRKITKGTTRARMNLTIMRNVLVPLPALLEQHQILKEIESRLSVCDKVEQSITDSLQKAQALRQSILKKAFEGTLLSPAEIAACKAAKDYEPASVLLERIKKEKQN